MTSHLSSSLLVSASSLLAPSQSPDNSLQALLNQSPYAGYAYSYPHKTAYRPFSPPISLKEAWEGERREALFLYLHIPFCEMRCGFCNLFTTTGRSAQWGEAYLDALERQAQRVKDGLGQASFARMAIGGGTPTILTPVQLHRLFDIAQSKFGLEPHQIPVSIETSPQTATPERLGVLRERGVERVSIGVQSFVEAEANAVGRSQRTVDVRTALEQLCQAEFPILNIDLMYGLPGQTLETWLATLQTALEYQPEEIYLYPLYIRPLTGIGRRDPAPLVENDDIRLACYRLAREHLIAQGYRQVSMRMFQSESVPASGSPVYCCQRDGMIGLGSGARSYTSKLHYSSEYAVGAQGVRDIIREYMQSPDEAFSQIANGFMLDEEEQRRRFLIQSLLQADGLSLGDYQANFQSDALDDVPQLKELEQFGLACQEEERLFLTERGIEFSDVIGPWLNTSAVRERMDTYSLR